MNLRIKKLMKMAIGTSLEVHYGNGNVFTGYISDKDDECIAISNGKNEIVIDYTDVELYIEGVQEPVSPQQPKAKAETAVPIIKETIDPGFKPSFETPIEKVGVSDSCLKDAFSELNAPNKKLLNNIYNRFMYALKTTDTNRSKQSYNTLLNEIEENDSLFFDEKVWSFAALMSARCNLSTDYILIKGKCFFRAAVNAYLDERYSDAGVFACLAVIYERKEDTENTLYSIIYNACIKCDDVSAVSEMLELSDILGLDMELVNALYAYKEKTPKNVQMSQRIKDLNSLYLNKEMAEKFQQIIKENNLGCLKKNSLTSNAENEDSLQIRSYKGKIVKLMWSRDEGKIEYTENDEDDAEIKVCSFVYNDITDDSLFSKVKSTFQTNVESMDWFVSFDFIDGKALNIKKYFHAKAESKENNNINVNKYIDYYSDNILPEDAIRVGRYIISSRADAERFAEAADTFEIALDANINLTDAMSELINACLAYNNNTDDDEDGKKYIAKALEKYKIYDEDIKHDLKYDVIAYSLMLKNGETKDKIKAIERLLKYDADAVKPQQRLIYIITLADIYLKEADQTKDKVNYENAKKLYQEWEALFHSNVQLFSEAALNKTYYTRVLLNLAMCLVRLDENEQAEQILSKILKYDPTFEVANNLYSKLVREPVIIENKDSDAEDETEDKTDLINDYLYGLDNESNEEDDSIPTTDKLQPYADIAGWEELGLTEKKAIDYVFNIEGKQKKTYTVALLKVLSDVNESFLPLYNAVSLAVDNPMQSMSFSANDIISAFNINSLYGEQTIVYSFACATLRSAFYQTGGTDYLLNALCDSVEILDKYPQLREVLDVLSDFKNRYGKGADTFATYRFADLSTQESKINAIVKRISDVYEQEFSNMRIRERINQLRFKLTKVIVYEKGGVLESTLKSIKDNDICEFEELKEKFAECFIRNGLKIQKNNIQDTKIEAFIDECWARAGRDERVIERKTSDLMGSLRNNIRSHIMSIVNLICEWTELYENGLVATIDSEEKREYAKIQGTLISAMKSLSDELFKNYADASNDEKTGISLLLDTISEISRKITGEWNQNERKYFFADFLRSNHILLDNNYMPIFSSTFYSLPEFNVFSRLCEHIENTESSIENHMEQIYSRNKCFNNFGTAKLIVEYAKDNDNVPELSLPDKAETYHTQAEERIKKSYKQFIEDIQLANGKGQIMLYDEFMSCIDDIATYWYAYSLETQNYGFFFDFVDACKKKLHLEAGAYKEKLLEELENMYSESPEYFEDNYTKKQVEEQINGLNFLVAEDWMNRLRRGDFYNPSSTVDDAVQVLQDFWNEFEINYDSSKDTGVPLKLQVTRGGYIPAKDKRGGMSLINNWLSNGNNASCIKIESILNALGWDNINISDVSSGNLEYYKVVSTEKHTKKNFSHPIAAYGTLSKNTGFNVVCLYGFYNADRLINQYHELDNIPGNKVILLDYALNGAERRRLARKVKEITLSNTYILIDRVSIIYVANHYVSGMNNRTLMSISMPFSYFQPYNDASSIDMPPEMFIGREDELLSIESPTGANLIFGGRQLGKSSLLKKARNDIDGDELGRKAVFIDIKNIDYKVAPSIISSELKDLHILTEDDVTSDWNELERAIMNRLRSTDDEIPYLLLMLDEADRLIESSKEVDFLPMVKFKNIQQSSNGKFKFVLAGLHDLVRFNRSVALGRNSVITHLSSINIKPFMYEDAKKLLLMPLSYLGFSFDDDSVLISQILAATNYFPGLIQLYCQKLIEAMRLSYADYNENETPPYVVSETHIKKVLSDKDFRDEIKKKYEVTLALDDIYYIIALLMALLDDNSTKQGGCTSHDILHIADELDINCISSLKEEQIEALLGELTDLNIFKEINSNSFAFSTKNFRDMLGSKVDIEEKLLALMEKMEG